VLSTLARLLPAARRSLHENVLGPAGLVEPDGGLSALGPTDDHQFTLHRRIDAACQDAAENELQICPDRTA